IYQGDDNLYYEQTGNSIHCLENIDGIPSYWTYIRFKDLVDFRIGKTPPRTASEFWGDYFPWVSITDMIPNQEVYSTIEKLSEDGKLLLKDKVSPKGTLIMSFKLTVGRVSILGMDSTHNEAIISVFPHYDKNNILRDYLFKLLPIISMSGETKKAIKGLTLNSKSMGDMLIPLTNFAEQTRIVNRLDLIEEQIDKL
ncbi:MAG: restriction endonuclease subunit S, partial [Tissierellia bacterium]|nr:restriction endonuclease subunit S [Tissierellia bacterium]